MRSALCAPLWFASGERDEVVGLVYLDNSSFVDAFDEEDLGLVTAIASVAAVKIHTTRLLQESRDNRRLKEEVRVAAEMQADLLPQTTPLLAGWSLAGGSRPCLAMGGDYYDWALGEDGLRLVLADVSGKGAAAAVLMAAVRALVRSRWAEADLARASRLISRAVFDNVPASRYATAFLARLDPPTGRLRFVNAGHQPALIVRADGSVQALASSGVPLGLMEIGDLCRGGRDARPGRHLARSSRTASARRATPRARARRRAARGAAAQRPGSRRGGPRAEDRARPGRVLVRRAPDDDRTLLVLKRVDRLLPDSAGDDGLQVLRRHDEAGGAAAVGCRSSAIRSASSAAWLRASSAANALWTGP